MSSNIDIMEMQVVKYGDNHFSLQKFKPVKDKFPHGWVKPEGGLWTSPVNASYGWKEWCQAEEFSCDFSKSFILNYKGNTIVIDSLEDLDKLYWREFDFKGNSWAEGEGEEWKNGGLFFVTYPCFKPLLDEGWDAIYLTEKGQAETRLSHPKNLYGWDCECLFIMNPKSVEEIKKPSRGFRWVKKENKKSS